MVGRSNVGKSSLINALVRKKLARTSAADAQPTAVAIERASDLIAVGLASGQLAPSELYENAGNGTFRKVSGFPETRIRGEDFSLSFE